jgi:AcrR family transcriptional regulator
VARVRAADRRNDFIDAAVQVIASHGIEGATTRRIAEQAAAPLAMLHYCYDSKEDLFADVYEHVAGRIREVLTTCDPHADLATTARELLRGLMAFYLDSADVSATALELISWARRQHEDRAIRVYNQSFDVARSILRDAAATDSVAAETIEQVAYVVATITDGFALNWLTYGDRAAAEEQLEIATSVLDAWLAAQLDASPAALG